MGKQDLHDWIRGLDDSLEFTLWQSTQGTAKSWVVEIGHTPSREENPREVTISSSYPRILLSKALLHNGSSCSTEALGASINWGATVGRQLSFEEEICNWQSESSEWNTLPSVSGQRCAITTWHPWSKVKNCSMLPPMYEDDIARA